MDSRITSFMMLVLAVSGCTQLPDSGGSEPAQQLSGRGLEVTDFRVSDKTLSPGQTVNVFLQLKNYHRNEIDIGDISLYNLGLLESSTDSGGPCTPSEISNAKKGVAPVMECEWRVTAPDEDAVGGFDQRPTSVAVKIPYDSVIENYRPFKLKFQPLSEINRTSKKSISFSNGEVDVKMQTETPVPLGQNKVVDFSVSKAGSGRIVGNYSFEYSPSAAFSDKCPQQDEPILRDSLDISCSINLEGSDEVTRNLFLTVDYKYVKSATTSITIVKNS